MLLAATALAVSAARDVIVPVIVAVLTAAGTLLLTRASDAANRRRDRYAQAVSALVSWVEFPYRVRRRTSDDPTTLSALADRGHDLQEQLACHHAWISTEHAALADAYHNVRAQLDALVGPALHEAWCSAPVTSPAEMVLGPWGPGTQAAPLIAQIELQIRDRFGWRRLGARLWPR